MGGILAKINYELLFWVDGCTNIAAALLMWAALKPVRQETSPAKPVTEKPVLSAYRDKTYLVFISITMLFAACFFQIFTNLPVYFRRDLHLSEPYIGLLMAINGIIIALVEMVMVYKLEGKRHSLFYITAGVALAGISFWLLNLPGPAVLIALLMILIITFGEIFSMPFMNSYWISRTQSSNRGQYAGLYVMAWSAAQTLGPMGGAQLAEHYGFNTLWWTAGVLSLIAAFSFRRLWKTS
jgi:predicted MFS family arabinose efflux permease